VCVCACARVCVCARVSEYELLYTRVEHIIEKPQVTVTNIDKTTQM